MAATTQLDKSTLDAIRDAIRTEVRGEVLDVVRETLQDIKKLETEQRDQPNPNEERFNSAAAEVGAKIDSSYRSALRDGYEPGQRMSRVVRAFATAKGNISAAHDALRKWGDTKISKQVERAMELETPQFGGFLVPEEYGTEMIELLRPASNLAKVQPRRVPLNGILHLPRVKVGTAAYWRPPTGSSVKASRPEVGRVTLMEKALTCIVAIPERMVQVASVDVDAFVRDEIVTNMGVQLDQAHYNGKGDEYEPPGIFNMPASGEGGCNDINVGALPTWTLPLIFRREHLKANGTLLRPAWSFNPDLEFLLMTLTPNAGTNPVWLPSMADRQQLMGYPEYPTSVITTSTASHNPTSMALVDYANYLLGGGSNGYEVATSNDAGYYDENGNVSLAFSNNERVVRVIWRGDMAARQPKAVTRSTNIWTS